MTWGNMNGDGSGYYNIAGRLVYFEKTPTEDDIQRKLAETEQELLQESHIYCGGACCQGGRETEKFWLQ